MASNREMNRVGSQRLLDEDRQGGSEEDGDFDRNDSQRSSRINSTDSEEAALTNGRKTLEEVAARLNDLDGERDATLEGKRGLISVSRIPFLANLFNYRSAEIVVDEEDRNQEDNPIADIFLWRFPLVSIIWFVILQVVFFLCMFCNYTLLSVGAFLFLWQLVMDLVLVRIGPSLKKAGIIGDDVDMSETVKKNVFFNAQLIKRVGSATYEVADLLIGMWRVTVLEANIGRVLVVSRFVVVVFLRSFSFPMTFWVLLMILFTVPVSYSKNRVIADVMADGAHVAASTRFKRFRQFNRQLLDMVEDRARKESEMKSPTAPLWKFVLAGANNLYWAIEKVIG